MDPFTELFSFGPAHPPSDSDSSSDDDPDDDSDELTDKTELYDAAPEEPMDWTQVRTPCASW